MPASAFTETLQRQLLALSRQSIEETLTGKKIESHLVSEIQASPMNVNSACFITLKKAQQLRGCIGTLEAYRPLLEDIIGNARAAAFNDPRFTPVTAAELDELRIHIAVLTPLKPLPPLSETALLRHLTPGVDGLTLRDDAHRATFLPAVWETLKTPQRFLQELKRKAGLPPEYWSDNLHFDTYQTVSFAE